MTIVYTQMTKTMCMDGGSLKSAASSPTLNCIVQNLSTKKSGTQIETACRATTTGVFDKCANCTLHKEPNELPMSIHQSLVCFQSTASHTPDGAKTSRENTTTHDNGEYSELFCIYRLSVGDGQMANMRTSAEMPQRSKYQQVITVS